MNNSPLEFLAKKYGNVVKYDSEGNDSFKKQMENLRPPYCAVYPYKR